MRTELSSRVRVVWWGACVLLAAALFASYRTQCSIDDAWITYRYAENLADGLGFVFNPGERVLGTSTPLYTLILAFVHWVGLPVPVTSQAIGFLSMMGILVGTYLLLRQIHSEVAGLLAISLLIPIKYFHRVVTYGMETPLYILCIVFAFYAYSVRRLHLATVLSACALLIRLDGAAVGAALVLAYWLTRRQLPWKLIFLYLGLTAPWLISSYLYFGTVLPHSFLAKHLHADSLYQTWMFEWVTTLWISAFALVGVGVCLAQSAYRSSSLPVVIWITGYLVSFTLSNLFQQEWYRTPLTVPLAGFAAVGVLSIAKGLHRFRLKPVWTIALLTLVLIRMDGSVRAGMHRLVTGTLDWRDRLESGRNDGAIWMNENLPKDATIVTGGIGMVGYVTQRYILDASGLVSPQVVVEGLPPAWPRFLPYIVEHHRPEHVYMASDGVPSYMARDYTITKTWPANNPARPFMLMQRKVSGSDADAQRSGVEADGE